MLFDPKNYPKLFIRGKRVNLWFTNIIRKRHAYNQRTKRFSDTSEGETLYFIVVYGQWLIVTFGKYSANGRDRPPGGGGVLDPCLGIGVPLRV